MARLAARIERAEVAAAVTMSRRARELRANGIEVISLAIGEPDFPTPPQAIEAAHQAALRGETKYPPLDGTPALKLAVQRKFARDQKIDYTLDEIIIANGSKQIIFDAMMATIDPGDEVVILLPYWSSYRDIVRLAGGEPVFVPCSQNNDFRPRAEDLAAALGPRTKWLILNFPNNPSGAACGRADLRAISAVLRNFPEVWVLSDDVYEHLVYDGCDYATIAAVAPELRDRTLTVNGVSKIYAMTGWRIGFAGGSRDLIRAMVKIQGQATAGVSTVGQAAAAAALNGPQGGSGRADGDLSRAARSGRGGAERGTRDFLSSAGRSVLRFSFGRGRHRAEKRRRAADRNRL